MRAPIALSKTKLMSLRQCPRKLWLEAYSPELEEPAAERAALRATGNVVGDLARRLYGPGPVVSFERGLRAAIDATRALVAAGGREPIFEATFDHNGVSVRVDVLDRSEPAPRLIEVKAAAHVKEHYLDDCAIQAWALAENGLKARQVAVATLDTSFVYAGDGRYDGLLVETDVTEDIADLLPVVPRWSKRRAARSPTSPRLRSPWARIAARRTAASSTGTALRPPASTPCSRSAARKTSSTRCCTRAIAISATCPRSSSRTTRSDASESRRARRSHTWTPSCARS